MSDRINKLPYAKIHNYNSHNGGYNNNNDESCLIFDSTHIIELLLFDFPSGNCKYKEGKL